MIVPTPQAPSMVRDNIFEPKKEVRNKKERHLFYSFTDLISLTTFYPNWVAFLWSVQFSRSVMSYSLQTRGLQHTRPPCPSPTLRVHPNSWPLSRWCHPAISPSLIPFSSCLQSCPASGSFPMSQLFTSCGQSYRSFSFNISPSNEYSELISFRMDWLDLLAVQGTLKSLL